ncbi:MAG: DNA-binding protein [Myxococcota bacterium]|nr:DNA-binding protein [Myxococcota bacterium]
MTQPVRTLSQKQMLRDRRRLIADGEWVEPETYERPADREDCRFGARPCLFVACRFHLYLDVNPRTGSIKFNFPGKEVHELEETCALDVAERGGITLEEVGGLMNLTRERVRQLEAEALDDLESIVDLTEEDITDLGARIE